MQWWNKKPSLNFLNNKTLNLPQTKRSDWISKETQLNSLPPKHKNLHQISKPRHTQMRKLTDFKAQVRVRSLMDLPTVFSLWSQD